MYLKVREIIFNILQIANIPMYVLNLNFLSKNFKIKWSEHLQIRTMDRIEDAFRSEKNFKRGLKEN